MFKEGIYEQVINKFISSQIDREPDKVTRVSIDKEEASKIISKYVAEVIERGLENIKDKGGDISSQVQLVNKIVDIVQFTTGESVFNEMMVDIGQKWLFRLWKNIVLMLMM